jgi:hypothetical protein
MSFALKEDYAQLCRSRNPLNSRLATIAGRGGLDFLMQASRPIDALNAQIGRVDCLPSELSAPTP